jgi:hypothetical protein
MAGVGHDRGEGTSARKRGRAFSNSREYQVGFKRPPKAQRFKPGQSGNPNGRPKGSKTFSTYFDQELGEFVNLNENGKPPRMPKRQVLAKQLVNKALGADAKVAGVLESSLDRDWSRSSR